MPPSVTDQANTVAARQLGPNISAIMSARGQYDAQSAREQANARAFSLALAHMMKSIGPQVHGAYHNAGTATASFAKGFSDAEQHRAANENASLGDFLDKAGIPADARAQALAHTGGTGDVLYGTRGYGPGAALEREGAAFGAAADQLPQTAIASGQQAIAQLLQSQQQGDQKYGQMIASEQGKIPGVASSILSSMGLTVTGQPKAGYYTDKSGNVLPDGYVWRNGHPVRSSSSSSTSIAQDMASDQPKLNSAAGKFFGAFGIPKLDANGNDYTYVTASKSLFSTFKYLIKEIPKAQQPRAKKILNGMIREALVGAGFKPPKPVSKTDPFSAFFGGW